MKKFWFRAFTIVGFVSGFTAAAFAVEQAGQAVTPKPAVLASSTSVPTPKITSVEGTIAALNLQAQSPTIDLSGTDGKKWTVAVNLKTTAVWQSAKPGSISDLKVGQHVKVRHAVIGGREVAKSIEVI